MTTHRSAHLALTSMSCRLVTWKQATSGGIPPTGPTPDEASKCSREIAIPRACSRTARHPVLEDRRADTRAGHTDGIASQCDGAADGLWRLVPALSIGLLTRFDICKRRSATSFPLIWCRLLTCDAAGCRPQLDTMCNHLFRAGSTRYRHRIALRRSWVFVGSASLIPSAVLGDESMDIADTNHAGGNVGACQLPPVVLGPVDSTKRLLLLPS